MSPTIKCIFIIAIITMLTKLIIGIVPLSFLPATVATSVASMVAIVLYHHERVK